MITRRQALAWAGLALALGASSLFFMIVQVSPFLADGTMNTPAVALFVLAFAVLMFGLGSLIALWIHRRWPSLTGVSPKQKTVPGNAALRQGFWVACAATIVAVLALMQELDIILVLITFGLMGLMEAYAQSRASR
ncbi:MAG: hypothetical protein WDZ49_16040 [Litorilinea sp.]